MNSNTTSRRTWKATCSAMQDGAVLSVHTYTVTIEREGDTLSAATVDGEAATLERAANLICWARATGSLTVTERYDAPTIGKARASRLHRILSRLGLGHADHYRAASAALGRNVDSLAALTEDEGRRVWNHARALRLAYQLAA